MTKSTDTPTAAPGMALQTLLRNAKAAALRELIGSSIMDTIQGLDPNLASGSGLGELAASLIEPSAALRDTQMRQRIIRMLPLPKARELGQRLDVKDGRILYDALCSKAADNAALEVLYSFFGVVRDPRAPSDTSPDAMQAPAGYPLFRSPARRRQAGYGCTHRFTAQSCPPHADRGGKDHGRPCTSLRPTSASMSRL